MTKEKIKQVAKLYDLYGRGGTGRGFIDDELAGLLAWASKKPRTKKETITKLR